MKPNVFISYKSEEYFYADKVRFALEQSGVPCWMAPESIQGGASYASSIPKAIRECAVFVVILTEKSQESQWVRRELDRAINEGRRIMPFVPEKMTFNDDIIFYLTNVQMYSAYNDWDRELNRMIDEICAELHVTRVKPQRVQPPQPVQPPQQPQPIQRPHQAQRPQQPQKPQKTPKAAKPKKKKTGLFVVLGAIAAAAVATVVIVVTVLNADVVQICGEKHRTGEKTIELSGQTIRAADVDAIGRLKHLQKLVLHGCSFDEDVSSLRSIRTGELTRLEISSCLLTGNLLNTLDFESSPIYSLNLSDNPTLSDLSCLDGIRDSLNTLDVSNIGSVDGEKVAACEKLAELNANDDSLTDLTAFGKLAGLETLSIKDNRLETLDGLETCIYLKSINASGNQLKNIEGLKNATLLETVNCNDNALSSADELSASADTLKKLYLRGNRFEDASFLKKLPHLEYLNLSDNALTDLTPLYDNASLVGIDASKNKVREWDLSSMQSKLQYVNLSDNSMESLTGGLQLAAGEQVQVYVDLSGNALREVTFTNPAHIDTLNLRGNPLANYESLYNSIVIINLIADYSEKMDFSKLSHKISGKFYLIDCPLNKQVDVTETMSGKVTYLSADEYAAKAEEFAPTELAHFSTTKLVIENTTG